MKTTLAMLLASVCLAVPGYGQQMVVAIDKFENDANASDELFTTLRKRITGSIVNTRKFEVVERQHLKSVLSERKLSDAGLTDEENAPAAGKLKAAGYVLYGSVLSLGLDGSAVNVGGVSAGKISAKVEIELRISSAETSKIIASKTIIARKSQSRISGDGQATAGNVADQVIEDAIRAATKKVTGALIDLAYPAKIIKVGKRSVTVNITQEQTELGAVYEVWEVGEELIDPDTGESLGADEELLGELEITRAKPKASIAKPRGDLELDDLEVGMIVRRIDEAVVKQRNAEEKAKKKKNFESRF